MIGQEARTEPHLCLDVQPQHDCLGGNVDQSKHILGGPDVPSTGQPAQKGKDVHKACWVDQRPCLPPELSIIQLPLLATQTSAFACMRSHACIAFVIAALNQ